MDDGGRGVDYTSHLSDDLLGRVFGFVDSHTGLAQASCVNRHWRSIISHPSLWQQLYLRSFPHSRSSHHGWQAALSASPCAAPSSPACLPTPHATCAAASQPGHSAMHVDPPLLLPPAPPPPSAPGNSTSTGQGQPCPTPTAHPAACPGTGAHWRELFRWKVGVEQRWEAGQRWSCAVMEGHRAWVNAVKLTPHSGRVVSGGADHLVMLWGRDGQAAAVLRGHQAGVWSLDASEARVLSGGMDSRLMVWDMAQGRLQQELGQVPAQALSADTFTSVQLLPGEQQVLSSSMRGALALWDLRCGRQVVSLDIQGPAGTRYPQQSSSAADSTQGGGLGAAEERGRGRAARLRSSGHAAYCARCLDQLVVASGEFGRLHLYDLRAAAKLSRLTAHDPEGSVFCLALNPQGQLLSGGSDALVKRWELAGLAAGLEDPDLSHLRSPAAAAAELQHSCPHSSGSSGLRRDLLDPAPLQPGWPRSPLTAVGAGHSSQVFSVALSAEGRGLSASEDASVRVWSPGRGQAGTGWPDRPAALRPSLVFVPSLDPGQHQLATMRLRGPRPPSPPAGPSQARGSQGGRGPGAPGADNGAAGSQAQTAGREGGGAPRAEAGAGQCQLVSLQGCAQHGCDIGCETLFVVGGRDSLVRLYSVDTQEGAAAEQEGEGEGEGGLSDWE
ncbi:WD40-repeat-containing domain protein [Haematococcus lacustris]